MVNCLNVCMSKSQSQKTFVQTFYHHVITSSELEWPYGAVKTVKVIWSAVSACQSFCRLMSQSSLHINILWVLQRSHQPERIKMHKWSAHDITMIICEFVILMGDWPFLDWGRGGFAGEWFCSFKCPIEFIYSWTDFDFAHHFYNGSGL